MALDQRGAITASAHGAPPIWVDIVYGAELWALWMAVQEAARGSSFRTDCLSVLRVFRSGPSAAKSGACKLARIWHGIFAALDDQYLATADIVWMPSHTVVQDVGVKVLSNGAVLSGKDRTGNSEADRQAKLAARADRVPDGRGKRSLPSWTCRCSYAVG